MSGAAATVASGFAMSGSQLEPAASPAFVLSLERGIEATAHASIHDIDATLWDACIAADEVQASHAFVAACEESGVEGARYWHLVIRRAGAPIAVASLFAMQVRLDLLAPAMVRRLLDLGRRLAPGLLRPHVLFCGLPVSAGRPCLGVPCAADLPDVLAAVSRAVAQAGREVGAQLHCVKEFTPAEAAALDDLRRHGFFRVPSLPTFQLEVPWRSFDAYLAGMRAGYRRQVRAGLRVAEREGVRIRRVADYGADCERFFALYEQVMDRAPFQLERLNLAFVRNLCRRLGDRTSALLVERGDELLAGAILLHTPGRLTFLLAGIDYAANRQYVAYPTLVAEVVAEAIRRRATVLELGQTSAALKSRLGAGAEDRFIYFRCPWRPAQVAFRASATFFYPQARPEARRVFRGGWPPA
jgi:hypothetical protein